MANLTVHVYKDSDGEFRVHPPLVILQTGAGGDKLEVSNHTEEDLFWSAPVGAFDANHPHGNGVGKRQKKLSQNGAAAAGSYPYVVYMLQSGKKAKGNSDPMIIVE